jgi:hypothetical protein
MGLDQYAYRRDPEDVATAAKGIEGVKDKKDVFATWRKHPALQGFMEELWEKKGGNKDLPPSPFGSSFNAGQEVELTIEDLDDLELLIRKNHLGLKYRGGFFFGDDCSQDEADNDMAFVKKARKLIAKGYRIYYSSWW